MFPGKKYENKYGREIINYDILKLWIVSSQVFFVQLIDAATTIIVFVEFIFAILTFAKFREKGCKIRTQIFAKVFVRKKPDSWNKPPHKEIIPQSRGSCLKKEVTI